MRVRLGGTGKKRKTPDTGRLTQGNLGDKTEEGVESMTGKEVRKRRRKEDATGGRLRSTSYLSRRKIRGKEGLPEQRKKLTEISTPSYPAFGRKKYRFQGKTYRKKEPASPNVGVHLLLESRNRVQSAGSNRSGEGGEGWDLGRSRESFTLGIPQLSWGNSAGRRHFTFVKGGRITI